MPYSAYAFTTFMLQFKLATCGRPPPQLSRPFMISGSSLCRQVVPIPTGLGSYKLVIEYVWIMVGPVWVEMVLATTMSER